MSKKQSKLCKWWGDVGKLWKRFVFPSSRLRRGEGERGSLQFPLILALFVLVVGGFGIWGCLRKWRFHMETQLRLNRCVGEAAQGFRDTLNSLDTMNLEIRVLRASIAAAQATPYVIPPLEAALQLVVLAQEVKQAEYKVKQAVWISKRGCGGRKDQAMALPGLDVIREEPDALGPKGLTWSGNIPDEFTVQVRHSPRAASARIQGGSFGEAAIRRWSTEWKIPERYRSGIF